MKLRSQVEIGLKKANDLRNRPSKDGRGWYDVDNPPKKRKRAKRRRSMVWIIDEEANRRMQTAYDPNNKSTWIAMKLIEGRHEV